MHNAERCARAYARAYLNTVSLSLITPHLAGFAEVESVLSDRRTLFFLRVPQISADEKRKSIDQLCKERDIFELIEPLLNLLTIHKRLHLIAAVLRAIAHEYVVRTHSMSFTITSAHSLSADERVVIERFLKRHVSGNVKTIYAIDPRLIAGISMQSDTLKWEHSIASQLRIVEIMFPHK